MRQSPLFSNIQTGEVVYDNVDQATYKGITIKTFILLAITIIVAAGMAFALPTILLNNPGVYLTTLVISSIVGFISVIVGRTSEIYFNGQENNLVILVEYNGCLVKKNAKSISGKKYNVSEKAQIVKFESGILWIG